MNHDSRRRMPWSAVLVIMVMITAACGSGDDSTADTTAFGADAGATLDEYLASATEQPVGTIPLPGATSDEDAVPGEHQFGASLDEFASTQSEGEYELPESEPPPEGFDEIQWEDLVPPGASEEEISARFDERIAKVEPGSAEADAVFEQLQAEYDNQPVNPAMAGSEIMLAGFVAPLTYDGDLITEFLLVPYFGACIHVPPPPANQTVMVSLEDDGLTIDESYGAVWVTGTLTLDGSTTDLAEAGYSISDAQTGVHDLTF